MNSPNKCTLSVYGGAVSAAAMTSLAPHASLYAAAACVALFAIIVSTTSPTPRLLKLTVFLAVFAIVAGALFVLVRLLCALCS